MEVFFPEPSAKPFGLPGQLLFFVALRRNCSFPLSQWLSLPPDFGELPEGLTSVWGEPELVMHIDLDKRDKLALIDINELKIKLEEDGYYLQMPPTQEELAGLVESNSKAPITR